MREVIVLGKVKDHWRGIDNVNDPPDRGMESSAGRHWACSFKVHIHATSRLFSLLPYLSHLSFHFPLGEHEKQQNAANVNVFPYTLQQLISKYTNLTTPIQ